MKVMHFSLQPSSPAFRSCFSSLSCMALVLKNFAMLAADSAYKMSSGSNSGRADYVCDCVGAYSLHWGTIMAAFIIFNNFLSCRMTKGARLMGRV